jgi:SAM-dependent methyltransferase
MTALGDQWVAASSYDAFMGRWSRPLARAFLDWLAPAPGGHWLELGCGTGALTAALCAMADPASVTGCDPSAAFIAQARHALPDPRVSLAVAAAEDPPARQGGYDGVLSGLVLNFVGDPARAAAAMAARLRPGGVAAAYVWDYAPGGLEFLRLFWEEAVALDPAAAALDERRRFPLCAAEPLAALLRAAGLRRVETGTVEITTEFRGFADYWDPFVGRTGPAPSYLHTLPPERRDALRAALERRLRPAADGRIHLPARAITVRGWAGV